MNVINTRLLQRLDTLQNWQTRDPVLLSGELAIVSSSTRTQFKVGNGTSTFNQLPYTDANLSTNAAAVGTGVSAQTDGSFATGINAQASALNAFVFNGDNSLILDQNNHLAFPPPYKDHGNGTFNVNAPLSDIYIQQSAFSDILSDKADKIALDAKITIDDQISGICAQTDLSIVKLSANDYAELVSTNSTVSNCLYIVEDDIINACGQQISNLAPGTSLSDAVNLEQLCDAVSSIQLPTDLSDFTNNSGFLTKTSADVDFQPVGNYLSSNALDNYKTYNATLSSLSADGYATQTWVNQQLSDIETILNSL